MEINVKLEAHDYSDRTPTRQQIINLLGEVSDFFNNLAGSLMATGEYHIARQEGDPRNNPVAQLLNASGALKNAQDAFNGATTSGIVTPRPQPQMVPRPQ
jgi:hypothetical protein